MNHEIRILAQHLLHSGVSSLSDRDGRLIRRLAHRAQATRDVNEIFDHRSTFGERLADRVAAVGGSWRFIVGFGVFLAIWAAFNVVVLAASAFDPYPFVFLNLLLSMLAALQAPVIMMSQNRQAAKDRLAAALDYEVNCKSETAIAELHDKVDLLTDAIRRLAASNDDERPEGARAALRVV